MYDESKAFAYITYMVLADLFKKSRFGNRHIAGMLRLHYAELSVDQEDLFFKLADELADSGKIKGGEEAVFSGYPDLGCFVLAIKSESGLQYVRCYGSGKLLPA